MGSVTKQIFVLVNFFLFWVFLNTESFAETKNNSIINLFCLENFKAEMSKANINYDQGMAKATCDCYLEEFSNSISHQKAVNKCKFETRKKFNL
tara:strand:+ start:184 stop:465 length:282 start_codon:yes stop_codon:yes gene_type:complete